MGGRRDSQLQRSAAAAPVDDDVDSTERGLIYRGSLSKDAKLFRLFQRGPAEKADAAIDQIHSELRRQAQNGGLHFQIEGIRQSDPANREAAAGMQILYTYLKINGK